MTSQGTARDIAERLRNGEKPIPVFTREILPAGPEGVVVISSLHRAVVVANRDQAHG